MTSEQADWALRAVEAQLAAIVQSSDDAIISKTLDGTIRSWNAAATRLFGYTAEEAIGRPITLIIPPARLAEELTIIERLRRGERIDHFETVRRGKDGGPVEVSLTVSPLKDADGHVIGASKIAREIGHSRRTAQELERAADRLAMAVAAANLGDWSWDATTDVMTMSPRAAEIFGLAAGSTVTRTSLREMLHPDDRAIARIGNEEALASRIPYDVEYRVLRAGGEVWVSAKGMAQYGATGAATGMYGVLQDITEKKNLEQELRRRAEALVLADSKKDEFIALLAHELRNPLAPIRTGVEVLKLGDIDDAAREKAVAMMDRQLSHMVRLIDDLLDVSRVNSGKLNLQRATVSLSEVLNHALEATAPAIDAAGHYLHVELVHDDVWLDADLTRLSQVFGNLLSNSAKYTPAGGHIWLRAERVADRAIVSVRDSGIGIPSSALANVFDMFSQVDRSVERSSGGLGIGLALVKGLVERHGGSVGAASEGVGRGSTFTVDLPVMAVRAPAVVGAGDSPSVVSTKRVVLVVDDNIDGAEAMAELLLLLGNDVHMAHDGIEAIEAAGRLRPDLILMDIGMPRMNGLEATTRIREQPWSKNITIVALTGWGQASDRERSREAGCDSHLVKPVAMAALEQVLSDLQRKVAERPPSVT